MMLFKEYLDRLRKIARDNPESLNMLVVYCQDDEGNGFNTVNFMPSIGLFSDYEFNTDGHPNAICIN